jgi:hypothetical protein
MAKHSCSDKWRASEKCQVLGDKSAGKTILDQVNVLMSNIHESLIGSPSLSIPHNRNTFCPLILDGDDVFVRSGGGHGNHGNSRGTTFLSSLMDTHNGSNRQNDVCNDLLGGHN